MPSSVASSVRSALGKVKKKLSKAAKLIASSISGSRKSKGMIDLVSSEDANTSATPNMTKWTSGVYQFFKDDVQVITAPDGSTYQQFTLRAYSLLTSCHSHTPLVPTLSFPTLSDTLSAKNSVYCGIALMDRSSNWANYPAVVENEPSQHRSHHIIHSFNPLLILHICLTKSSKGWNMNTPFRPPAPPQFASLVTQPLSRTTTQKNIS
ncbi:hypothetical protein C8F01DRAFT_1375876 [Mycena amicta]|nr:hypothetical protein C8F01DRAFT_1375876 [Mycena amicta]